LYKVEQSLHFLLTKQCKYLLLSIKFKKAKKFHFDQKLKGLQHKCLLLFKYSKQKKVKNYKKFLKDQNFINFYPPLFMTYYTRKFLLKSTRTSGQSLIPKRYYTPVFWSVAYESGGKRQKMKEPKRINHLLEKTTPKLVICALFPKNDLLPVGFLSFVE
jgi:hypothetical protein